MSLMLRQGYAQFITSGGQLILLFIGLKAESREGWTICLALIAAVSLITWMSTLRRRRAITDTPTSRIASAAQGYVELMGTGRPLDHPPLLSHLTRLPCLWYRYQVEEKKSGDKWETVSRGESDVPFIIDDGSGRCVVDVEGAEILTRHKETWTEGHYRNTEWKLLINDEVYALGDFHTLGGGSVDLNATQDLNDLLAEWKKDKVTLLERFDLNGDGEIDMQEWGLARQAARREIVRMHREARNDADVHTLRCPRNGRHYLLSNLDPNKLARRFLLWSGFHVVIFLASLGAIPWMLNHYR